MAYIYLDSYELPEPQVLSVENKEIGVTDRLAGGRMVCDIVCTKKVITMTWPFLDWLYLKRINQVFLAGEFVTLIYPYAGVEANSIVGKVMNIGPENLQFIETATDEWSYINITVTIEEQ